jgi:hypothetical protein
VRCKRIQSESEAWTESGGNEPKALRLIYELCVTSESHQSQLAPPKLETSTRSFPARGGFRLTEMRLRSERKLLPDFGAEIAKALGLQMQGHLMRPQDRRSGKLRPSMLLSRRPAPLTNVSRYSEPAMRWGFHGILCLPADAEKTRTDHGRSCAAAFAAVGCRSETYR